MAYDATKLYYNPISKQLLPGAALGNTVTSNFIELSPDTLSKIDAKYGTGFVNGVMNSPNGGGADLTDIIGTVGQATGGLVTNYQLNQNPTQPQTTTSPQTSTQTSQTSQTTSQPKTTNQGFTLSGNNLKLYSQGDDVKNLQKYLSGVGLYQGKVDGIFGPQTQDAVKQFQSIHGLTTDGIVGPKTASAMQSVQSGSTPSPETQAPQTNQPPQSNQNEQTGTQNYQTDQSYNTGDSNLDTTLKELNNFVQNQLAQGLTINPNLNFDQDTLDKFLETAKTQVHPYYAQQIDAIKNDVLRNASQITGNYENDIAAQQQNFQDTLGNARENYAQSGLTFSGQRTKGEQNIANTQNRTLQGLNTAYANKLYDLGTSAEQKIGSGNVNYTLPSLSQYSANLGGLGGFDKGQSISQYNPGQYKLGSIGQEEQAAIEARNQALKKTASADITSGRNYQDLFQ